MADAKELEPGVTPATMATMPIKRWAAMVPPPLVSIITVVLRDCEELAEILRSVLPARGPDVEVIVIDGGSDDGTVALLKSLNASIDYWLSEPDTGIYNAMNKGLYAARGAYILHLNAGDRLRILPLEDLRAALAEEIDVVSCRVLMDGKVEFVSRTSWLLRIDNTWHHQGTFYRRSRHLGYDESYRIAGDFDLNQRMARLGYRTRQLDTVVADHRNDGISASAVDEDFPDGERYRCIRANHGIGYMVLALIRFKLLALRRWLRQHPRTARVQAAVSNLRL